MVTKKWIQSLDLAADGQGRLGIISLPAHKPQMDVVSVGTASKTLGELLPNASIETWTNRITLVPLSTGIYMDDGPATNQSHPMGLQVHELAGGPDILDELEFVTASGTVRMTVIQEG